MTWGCNHTLPEPIWTQVSSLVADAVFLALLLCTDVQTSHLYSPLGLRAASVVISAFVVFAFADLDLIYLGPVHVS